ncbi:MAG TPA: hypothetical protein PLW86_11400, partial [Rhodocyclaceae bacterium]|nr:hypothetical protein [Rhodocyclaceae bacterium]
MATLPLLVFPIAKTIIPPKGNGFPPGKPHLANHGEQVRRLTVQLDELWRDFSLYKASISGAVDGLEPETVLVIEIAGSIEGFMQAVEATDGLEWLGEWDIEGDPDEYFYAKNTKGEKTAKKVAGRLFLSLGNEQGLQELLRLWAIWEQNGVLPHGKTKWRDVFSQTRKIRRWGIEETLRETNALNVTRHWHKLIGGP